MYTAETCTAPEKGGADGGKDDVRYEIVTAAVTSPKDFFATDDRSAPVSSEMDGPSVPPCGRSLDFYWM